MVEILQPRSMPFSLIPCLFHSALASYISLDRVFPWVALVTVGIKFVDPLQATSQTFDGFKDVLSLGGIIEVESNGTKVSAPYANVGGNGGTWGGWTEGAT
jgi:hypothetical protein